MPLNKYHCQICEQLFVSMVDICPKCDHPSVFKEFPSSLHVDTNENKRKAKDRAIDGIEKERQRLKEMKREKQSIKIGNHQC